MQRIALFRVWDTHPIDHSILQVFEKNFPEYRLEIFTIMDFLRARKYIQLVNVFFVIWYYGARILRGEFTFRQVFLRTPYIFNQVSAYAHIILRNRPSDTVFSFQLQSLFDTSIKNIDHFVYTDHTHLENLNYSEFSDKKLYASAWINCEHQVYAHAKRVFTRSTNISLSLREQYHCKPEKIVCVYGGSNIPLQSFPIAEKKTSKRILFVGIDWERKGGPDLIEAFLLVLKKHPDAQLTIIGGQPNLNHPQIQVVGRVSPAEMPKYYLEATVFCLPTKLEPFGAVLIEALAYKLPVIATRIGAIPDFVIPGENGYLIMPGDIQGIAEALIDILSDPAKCVRFGEAGYDLVQTRYTWESVGARMRQEILSALME